MTAKCPICGAPLEGEVCGYCGYAKKTQMQPTPVAYANNVQQQPRQEPPQIAQPQVIQQQTIINNAGIIPGISRKSKTVALLLCIFLGYFGVHKFYVGKVGSGILYLCTLGLFGFGWIIDIILIVAGSFKDEFGLPLKQ